MKNKTALLRAFWGCGDNQIIEFAIRRSRLNRNERQIVRMILDECMTQECTAEALNSSTRHIQHLWDSAAGKLLSIPWVLAYAQALHDTDP